jgi:hypothetical protein
MVRLQAAFYFIMLEQNRARARILRKDEVSLLQNLDRSECHVFKISDRGRNYI